MKQAFLYLEPFDFPDLDCAPTKIIALVFAPRSGSTLLSCLMQQTGVLGFPLEYFAKANLETLMERMPGLSLQHVEPLLRVRSSPNGVFGYKWNQSYQRSMPEIGKRLAPHYCIVIDREDLAAQARSLALAIKTREWVCPKGETSGFRLADVRDEELRRAEQELLAAKRDIRRMVESSNTDAMEVSYEALLEDPQAIVARIVEFVGETSRAPVSLDEVPIAKQAQT